MNLFAESKLKGQKLKLSNLISKPDFKQQYLAQIRTLEEDDQCKLLQKIIDNELSIQELKQAASDIKIMTTLKKSFLKLVNIDSWEQAQEEIPQFACLEQLMKFSKISLSQGIPQSFIEFCSRAKQSIAVVSDNTDATHATCIGENCYVLISKYTEICGNFIARSCNKFNGAHLTLISLSRVCVQYMHICCICTYVQYVCIQLFARKIYGI